MQDQKNYRIISKQVEVRVLYIDPTILEYRKEFDDWVPKCFYCGFMGDDPESELTEHFLKCKSYLPQESSFRSGYV